MDTLSLALQITLIGMALVFGAIILLWAVMAALVRLTADRAEDAASASAEPEYDAFAAAERDRKRRAAAIAVAVALEYQAESVPHLFPLPPTAEVTPWQAVTRSSLMRKARR